MLEDFRTRETIQGSSDRSFGIVFAALFLAISLLPLRHHQPLRIWPAAVSAALLVVALALPQILAPANVLWTRFGMLLHRLVSPIAMGAIFFFVAAPSGLLMRAFGKDPLRLKWEPQAESYWIQRASGPAPETMRNQF